MTQLSVIPAQAGILKRRRLCKIPAFAGDGPLRGRFEYWFPATQFFLAMCHVSLQRFPQSQDRQRAVQTLREFSAHNSVARMVASLEPARTQFSPFCQSLIKGS